MKTSKNPIHAILATALLLALGGCIGMAPNNFKLPAQASSVILSQPVVYPARYNIADWEATLAAGLYQATREDQGGTYYTGAPGCFSEKLLKTSWNIPQMAAGESSVVDCGIYVPFDEALPIRIFSIFGTGRRQSGQAAQGIDPALQTQAILSATTTSPAPVQAAVGAGLGNAIGMALLDSQKGNFQFIRVQPDPQILKAAIQRNTP